MRVILRRGVAAVAFVAACSAVLPTGDSMTAIPQAAAAAPPPVLKAASPLGMAAERDFLVSHKRWIPLGRRSLSVPILMYHYIRTPPSIYGDRLGYNLSVAPAIFHAQMDWLSVHGYNPIDFNDLRAYFGGVKVLPDKPVVITFDDGYQDLYTTAYPILRSYNFKAVAYIVTSFVGQSRYVTAAQVLEMDHHGIEIASHTVDHADLARTSVYWATFQLSASKSWLEHLVGHAVVDFAYPSGKFNARVIAALQATGYDTAVTEVPGTAHSRADRYTWTRVRVGGGESMSDFVQNLGPIEPALAITTITTVTGEP